MPEETTPRGEGETTPDSTDTTEELADKPVNSIDRANEAINRMKAENDRTEDLVKRQEALKSEEILSGKADAGKEPDPPEEDTPEEYARKVLAGEAV